MICEETLSKKYNSAGYLFFENKQGFHYRSYESLIAYNGLRTKTPQEYFVVETGSVRGGGGNLPVQDSMRRIRKFNINKQYDTIANMRGGAFASNLITVDTFNKKIESFDYNYFNDFNKYFHLQGSAFGDKTDNFHLLPDTPSDEFNKNLSDYPSKRFMYSTTDKIFDDFKGIEYKDIVRQRNAQRILRNHIMISVEISGNTTIDAGDVIHLEIPQVKQAPRGEDLFLSGNYLIRHIRHNVSILANTHTTTMECVKDSVRSNYPAVRSSLDNTFIGREKEKNEAVNLTTQEATENVTWNA